MSDTPTPLWLRAAPFIFLLFWSSGYPVSKLGMVYAAPFSFLALRYATVLLVLAPLALWLRPPLPKRAIDWLHLAMVGFAIQIVYFGGCYGAFAIGTSAGAVALICSLQPILVAVLAPLLVGERTSPAGWAGLLLGFAGALLVIHGYNHAAHVPLLGVALSVLALCGMTGATLYEKRFGVTQHPVTANLVQYAVGFAIALPIAAAMGFRAALVPGFLVPMLYLVVANSLISISLFLAMVRYGRAAQVSALFYLVPPVASLMAWGLLAERPPALAWAGMVVAGLGVAITRWQPKRALKESS
jgi:drug/metabolite transporter (DMT)-like permease